MITYAPEALRHHVVLKVFLPGMNIYYIMQIEITWGLLLSEIATFPHRYLLSTHLIPKSILPINILRLQVFFINLTAGKGFWSEMLGVGDFYYELGVQVIEVCMATNHRNGGRSHCHYQYNQNTVNSCV